MLLHYIYYHFTNYSTIFDSVTVRYLDNVEHLYILTNLLCSIIFNFDLFYSRPTEIYCAFVVSINKLPFNQTTGVLTICVLCNLTV